MFLSVLPLGTVPKRKGGEKSLGLWNWRETERERENNMRTSENVKRYYVSISGFIMEGTNKSSPNKLALTQEQQLLSESELQFNSIYSTLLRAFYLPTLDLHL